MNKLVIAFVIATFAAPTMAFADAALDYKSNCAACHGAGGNLLPKTARMLKVDPRKLALKVSNLNRDEMIAAVEKGRNKMPAFEKELTKEQIAGVVDYVRDLNKKK